jgi:hypothetical protein
MLCLSLYSPVVVRVPSANWPHNASATLHHNAADNQKVRTSLPLFIITFLLMEKEKENMEFFPTHALSFNMTGRLFVYILYFCYYIIK